VNSSHKCNSLGIKKDLERRSVIQALARPIVELGDDLLNKGKNGVSSHITALVGVLIRYFGVWLDKSVFVMYIIAYI
jgi:hypothetical protein